MSVRCAINRRKWLSIQGPDIRMERKWKVDTTDESDTCELKPIDGRAILRDAIVQFHAHLVYHTTGTRRAWDE